MDAHPTEHGEAHAPILQGLWEPVRSGQEEILLSPYLPASYAFLTHVLLCAPFLALDALGGVCQRVRSWRIASGSGPPPSLRRWFDCFWRVLYRYLIAVFPATALFQTLRNPKLPQLAPSCWQLFVEVFACLLLFDMLFFLWHVSMHRVPWLYRNTHQLHHQHHIPFALAAQDSSSLELLSLLLLALSSAWVVDCHPLSEAFFHLINSWLAVEDHCGYNLPWALHRLLPCLGGAPYHQAHHTLHSVNYAPYFTHWDLFFGTYRAPVQYLRPRAHQHQLVSQESTTEHVVSWSVYKQYWKATSSLSTAVCNQWLSSWLGQGDWTRAITLPLTYTCTLTHSHDPG